MVLQIRVAVDPEVRLLVLCGKQNSDARPSTRFAVNVDQAASTGDDLSNGGETESCPRAPLGCKERVKGAGTRFRIHTNAVVLDRKQDTWKSVWCGRIPLNTLQRLHLASFRTKSDAPSVRHGIPRIEHQIEHNLLRLGRIYFHQTQVWIEVYPEINPLTAESFEKALHALDGFIQREQPGLPTDGLGERQQLADQSGSLESGLVYFFRMLSGALPRFKAGEQKIAVQQNPGHQVVEVVCKAGGHPADRLKPSCLALPLKVGSRDERDEGEDALTTFILGERMPDGPSQAATGRVWQGVHFEAVAMPRDEVLQEPLSLGGV